MAILAEGALEFVGLLLELSFFVLPAVGKAVVDELVDLVLNSASALASVRRLEPLETRRFVRGI